MITSIWLLISNREMPFLVISLLITFALLAGLSAWLIFKNNPKFDKDLKYSSNLMPTGLAIGGMILFSLAIADLPLLIAQYTSSTANMLPNIGINSNLEKSMAIIGNLIQLSIGALIFFKAKYFSKLINDQD